MGSLLQLTGIAVVYLTKSMRNLTLKNKYFLYFRILLKAGRLLLEKETSHS